MEHPQLLHLNSRFKNHFWVHKNSFSRKLVCSVPILRPEPRVLLKIKHRYFSTVFNDLMDSYYVEFLRSTASETCECQKKSRECDGNRGKTLVTLCNICNFWKVRKFINIGLLHRILTSDVGPQISSFS